MYSIVLQYFSNGKMCPQVNTTCITMIPKSLNADTVGLFRPISCCYLLNKLIAKVLTSRLREFMSSIIVHAQDIVFRPQRSLDIMVESMIKINI